MIFEVALLFWSSIEGAPNNSLMLLHHLDMGFTNRSTRLKDTRVVRGDQRSTVPCIKRDVVHLLLRHLMNSIGDDTIVVLVALRCL